MEYASCNMISGMTMHINGRIDTGENVIRLCCESLPDVPGVPLTDSPEESLRNFIGMRTMILAESIHNARLGQKNHRFSAGCTHCTYYRPGDYKINPFISYVNLSTYPSPCQCHASIASRSIGRIRRESKRPMKICFQCWSWVRRAACFCPTRPGRFLVERLQSTPIGKGS